MKCKYTGCLCIMEYTCEECDIMAIHEHDFTGEN